MRILVLENNWIVQLGPAKLNDISSKAPTGSSPKCTDASSLNLIIAHCVRRETFFQCPGLSTSQSCKALLDYGKACPKFPFHMGPPKDKVMKREVKKPELNQL